MDLRNGDCLELMKTIPDKSVDLFICDLPFGELNCKWDIKIDMEEFWKEFKRIRKSPKVACIHFCSTKFGYTLIKSWEKGFKMDMVWKKKNKTGGLQSRNRPMRNHEMVYFFYDQAPKYNRDKYHKRIKATPNPKTNKEEQPLNNSTIGKKHNLNSIGIDLTKHRKYANQPNYIPLLPASVVEEEEKDVWGKKKWKKGGDCGRLNEDGSYKMGYEPPNPASVFDSEKVFIGKRNHQTEKPQDILEFFLKYWTDEDDVVLDPTMGSGSTGVACQTLKRKFIGFELDPKIYEVACNRINKIDLKTETKKLKKKKKTKKI